MNSFANVDMAYNPQHLSAASTKLNPCQASRIDRHRGLLAGHDIGLASVTRTCKVVA